MKKLLLFLGIFSFAFATVPASPAHAWSLFPDKVCNTTEARKSTACIEAKAQQGNENPVANLIGDAANIIALVAGFVAVLMIIIAGFQFVTSGGNAEQTTKARGRIFGAIIGLVVIALAWTIIRLVLDAVIK